MHLPTYLVPLPTYYIDMPMVPLTKVSYPKKLTNHITACRRRHRSTDVIRRIYACVLGALRTILRYYYEVISAKRSFQNEFEHTLPRRGRDRYKQADKPRTVHHVHLPVDGKKLADKLSSSEYNYYTTSCYIIVVLLRARRCSSTGLCGLFSQGFE